MKKDILFRELIKLEMEVKNQKQLFEEMADILLKQGFVKDTYLESIMAREEVYPTALPIEPYPVAIPHTNIEHIAKPFIAAIRLKNEIEWREMANNDIIHQVKFIFMLGFLNPDDHIDLLQILVDNFQDEKLMENLKNAENIDEYFELLCKMQGMEE